MIQRIVRKNEECRENGDKVKEELGNAREAREYESKE